MSLTSTSNSDGPKHWEAATRFRPKEVETIPEVTRPWLRWAMVALMLLLAEGGVRMALYLDLVEKPFLYSHQHIDNKVDRFFNEFLPANEPGERYLVMGSSMPHTNIDPVRLSRTLAEETGRPWSGFNGAFLAGRHEDMLFFLDWYYDRWKFDHLVMTLEPWGMRPGRLDEMQERLSKPPLERWLMEHSALFAIRNQWNPPMKNMQTRGLIELDRNGTMHGWVRTVQEFASDPAHPEKRAQEQARDLRNYFTGKLFGTDDANIAKVQQWAAERNVTVWWLIQPTAPVLEQFLPPQYQYPAWRKYAEGVASQPGNYLIDLKDLEGRALRNEDFFDSNHMNPRAAGIYSVEIGKRFARSYKAAVAKGLLKENPR